MAFSNISVSNTKKSEPIEAGMYLARCYSIIDFGTQKGEWMKEETIARKVNITFELPELMEVFSPEKGEQPRVIGKTYTISTHEKSSLSKDLISWLGNKKLDGDVLYWLDKYVLGTPAFLNIVNKEVNGNVYSNIASISPVPKGMEVASAINPPVRFDLEDFDKKVFDGLPNWQKEIIMKSPEYEKAANKSVNIPQYQETDDLPF